MINSEYERIKNYTYTQYCDYLRNKYKRSSKEGLFRHHFYEIYKAGLSNPNKQDWLTEQEKNTIIYCDFLEHLLLHIIIAEYNQYYAQLQLGINGAIKIYGCIYNYQTYKQMDYKKSYYDCLDSIVIDKLLKRLEKVNEWYGKDIYADCYIQPAVYRRQSNIAYKYKQNTNYNIKSYYEENDSEKKCLKERIKNLYKRLLFLC